MADLPISDRAEILSDSLGIRPESYAGREGDAIVAMTLVAGYRILPQPDKDQVLYVISDRMRFGQTNPAFFQQCQNAVALMVANPVWVPGSLSNDELESEIRFWRTAQALLTKFNFTGFLPFVVEQGKSILSQVTTGSTLASAAGRVISSPFTPALAAGSVAQSIASASLTTLQAEVDRRGMTGKMTPLHVHRYGGKP